MDDTEFVRRSDQRSRCLHFAGGRFNVEPAGSGQREQGQGSPEREGRKIGITQVQFPGTRKVAAAQGEFGFETSEEAGTVRERDRVAFPRGGTRGGKIRCQLHPIGKLSARRSGLHLGREAGKRAGRIHRRDKTPGNLERVDRHLVTLELHGQIKNKRALAARAQTSALQHDVRATGSHPGRRWQPDVAFKFNAIEGQIKR